MSYSGYIQTISSKFDSLFSEISAEHNFDYGPEYEIALCKVLRAVLPIKFGVCRGFATTFDGKVAGDDIIIYDQERFPTLRLLEDNTYAQKQNVPIEAIYAYIEAKHTLNLAGDDPQSLSHASEQVGRVKELINTRVSRRIDQITPYLTLNQGIRFLSPPQMPKILNPALGIIFARSVKRSQKEKTILSEPKEIEALATAQKISSREAPDICVLGKNHIILPIQHNLSSGTKVVSPFYIQAQSQYEVTIVEGIAFGIALMLIMDALDWIQLGLISWSDALAEVLNLSNRASKPYAL